MINIITQIRFIKSEIASIFDWIPTQLRLRPIALKMITTIMKFLKKFDYTVC